jgi:hypothetical protein
MIKQLRPFHTPEELAKLYAEPYDHSRWPQHVERVGRTTELLDWLAAKVDARTVADLSCGDGAVVNGSTHPWAERYLGDFAPGFDHIGRIERTIHEIPSVDVFVLSETLEHVQWPADLLAAIRQKARYLLLSTPLAEFDDRNPEHYWGWDEAGVYQLLNGAGWQEESCELFTPQSGNFYTYQIWMAS